MEADILGKHVYHYVNETTGGLTREKLSNHGFA
jgi:hypothetical protein